MNFPHVGDVSIGTSNERRFQTLAVFFFSLYFLPMLGCCCLGLTTVLIIFWPATPFILTYLVWIYCVDKGPLTGRDAILRGGAAGYSYWRYFCDFFPITLIKTAELDPNKKYVMGYHPHGIISVGALGAIATNGPRVLDLTKPQTSAPPLSDPNSPRGFSTLFPGMERWLITLPVNFLIPFSRELLLWLGICNSERTTFRNVLGRGPGTCLVVVVGGAKEATYVEPGEIRLVLENRKGFVREAIISGADLVPILAFGETDLYASVKLEEVASSTWFVSAFKSFRRLVARTTGVSTPIFRGRGIFLKDIGLMPLRKPVNLVVGAPVETPRVDKDFKPKFDRSNGKPLNDDARVVEEVHHRYIEAVKSLYQTHKNALWNTPGINRRGTLKID